MQLCSSWSVFPNSAGNNEIKFDLKSNFHTFVELENYLQTWKTKTKTYTQKIIKTINKRKALERWSLLLSVMWPFFGRSQNCTNCNRFFLIQDLQSQNFGQQIAYEEKWQGGFLKWHCCNFIYLIIFKLYLNEFFTQTFKLMHHNERSWFSLNSGVCAPPPSVPAGRVRSLSSALWSLTHLTALHLSDNSLSRIPPDIAKLHNLVYLDLSSNKIRSLPAELGNMVSLRSVFVGYSKE